MIVAMFIYLLLLSLPTIRCFICNNKNTFLKSKKLSTSCVKSIQNGKFKLSKQTKLTMGVEHLVECNANSGVSNGFLNFDMCLDHDTNHIMQMLAADMFERIITIGILVATYFYMKRLAVTDPVNSDFVPNSNINRNDFEFNQQCPKCNGTGRNLFSKSLICDLCGGTGEIDLPTPTIFNLPRKPDIDEI